MNEVKVVKNVVDFRQNNIYYYLYNILQIFGLQILVIFNQQKVSLKKKQYNTLLVYVCQL